MNVIKSLKLLFATLGVVSLFAASANAEFISGEFTVGSQFTITQGKTQNESWYQGTLTLDLSGYDIDPSINNFKFNFSSVLETKYRFQGAQKNETVTALAGAYGGTVKYDRLEVKAGGFTLSSRENVEEFTTYDLPDNLDLEYRNQFSTEAAETDLSFLDQSAGMNIAELLDENGLLVMTFNLTGLNTFTGRSYPDGTPWWEFSENFTTIIYAEDLIASASVTFSANSSATPEPASFLIFGAISALGLPFVRRFRRKT